MGTGLENVWHEVCREAVCMVNQGAERRRSRAVECPHPNGYIGTSSTTFETVTLERILEGGNMKRALRSVCANKGSAGVDGMKTTDLLPFIMSHPHLISESVRTGKYRPSPIRRVWRTAAAGDSNRNRQTDTAGNCSGPVCRLRKCVLRQQFWVQA